MTEHWEKWFTEQHVKDLAARGVEMVRLPIGDWVIEPYGPYIGCMDGAKDKITWMLDTCHKYGIRVFMEVHCWAGSQNGFDNSGRASQVNWLNETHYEHWATRAADWMGHWNVEEGRYEWLSPENIDRSVNITSQIFDLWGRHPAFAAFEPVNEPWNFSDMGLLKGFYRRVRELVRSKTNPGTKFVFYADDISSKEVWDDLFEASDREDVVLDNHYYQAWSGYTSVEQACQEYEKYGQRVSQLGYEIWVGEWSLATDKCAHWLGGLNEGIESDLGCNWVECPAPYLSQWAEDVPDRAAEFLGPFG